MPNELPYPTLEVHCEGTGALRMLTDDALFQACRARIAFTGREGGVSVGSYASLNTGLHVNDDGAHVQCNRELVLAALGAPQAALIVPNQVHGTNVVMVGRGVDVNQARALADGGADAVVVGQSEVAALLNYADCLPLIIVSPRGTFAVVHAGWRGAVAHIAAKAVHRLADLDGCSPARFNAYLGPHIRSECFEVSEEIAQRFAGEFGESVLADAQYVNLAAAVSADLVSAGLLQERIADAGICTVCNSDKYFSYRATHGACGRHAAAAVRV